MNAHSRTEATKRLDVIEKELREIAMLCESYGRGPSLDRMNASVAELRAILDGDSRGSAAGDAIGEILKIVEPDAPDWEYPGQVVRDVQRRIREDAAKIERLTTETGTQTEAIKQLLEELYVLRRDNGGGRDALDAALDAASALRESFSAGAHPAKEGGR